MRSFNSKNLVLVATQHMPHPLRNRSQHLRLSGSIFTQKTRAFSAKAAVRMNVKEQCPMEKVIHWMGMNANTVFAADRGYFCFLPWFWEPIRQGFGLCLVKAPSTMWCLSFMLWAWGHLHQHMLGYWWYLGSLGGTLRRFKVNQDLSL